jgi:short-subunit dehydrogenase
VPNQAHYAATKAYVQTLAEGLHGDLKPLGIDVLSAAPGPVRTPFLEKAGLASPMGDNVDVVARDILRALGRKATVRPGFWGKMMGLLLGPAPRRLRTATWAPFRDRFLCAPRNRNRPNEVGRQFIVGGAFISS